MEATITRKLVDFLGSELSVFSTPPRVGPTPSTTEIAAMIKGGKPGDMDKEDE
ncbi:hypothetical protein [Sinorhizobium meliloti]|nr:hypothetical protein U8C39_33840 [Sinorhizobium meliloti]WQP20096.1 hypothetical protein U8C33_34535 [Sinorhizobium meliloti]WQP33532.1 hypothetical protein U8C45_33805 [Sinorhizobium meliloti]